MTSGCNALRRVAAPFGLPRYSFPARLPLFSGLNIVGRFYQPQVLGTSAVHCHYSTSCTTDVTRSPGYADLHGPAIESGHGLTMERQVPAAKLELKDPKMSKTSIKVAESRALHLQRKQARLEREQGVNSRFNWQAIFKRLKSLSPDVPRVFGDRSTRHTSDQSASADSSLELHRLSPSAPNADERHTTKPSTSKGDRDERNIKPANICDEGGMATELFSEDAEPVSISAVSDEDKGLTLEGYETIMVSLLKQGMLPNARQILRQILQDGPNPKVSTFNIFVHDCAQRKNLKSSNVFLGAMARSEVSADAETWAAFFETVASFSAKQAIAVEMYQRNLICDEPIAQLVSRTIVDYSFGAFIDKNNDVEDYIKTLDMLFGHSWTTELAIHRMLHVLGERGRFLEAVRLVDDLSKSKAYIPDVFDLTVLLGHCATYIAVDTAVNLVRIATDRWNVKLDHKAFDTLFTIFWKGRLYNATRVTWRYACYYDNTTNAMRQRVLHSLTNTDMKPTSTMAVKARWETSAGSVLVLRSRKQIDKESAPQILNAERRLWKRVPQHSLAEKLEEAIAMDKEWALARVRRTTDTYWKLQNVIRIGHDRPVTKPIEVVRLDVQAAKYTTYQRLRQRMVRAARSGSLSLSFGRPRQVPVSNAVSSARRQEIRPR